jgi:hypothetical protein
MQDSSLDLASHPRESLSQHAAESREEVEIETTHVLLIRLIMFKANTKSDRSLFDEAAVVLAHRF